MAGRGALHRSAAIVHRRGWNRQAAWLSALLRTRDCVVRCYGHKDYRHAMTRLCEGVPKQGSPGCEIRIDNGVPCSVISGKTSKPVHDVHARILDALRTEPSPVAPAEGVPGLEPAEVATARCDALKRLLTATVASATGNSSTDCAI